MSYKSIYNEADKDWESRLDEERQFIQDKARKDWIGNTQSVMATLNASSHSEGERGDNDYYATPPKALDALFKVENFDQTIWEPACGGGHLSEAIKEHGKDVHSTDLIDRGYGTGGVDFLTQNDIWPGDIITNPPYILSTEFVYKAMSLLTPGKKLAFLLRIQFLESVKRRKLFAEYPPKFVYVFSRNIRCAKNGDFKNATGNASTYAWFVWEKGFIGEPIVRWL